MTDGKRPNGPGVFDGMLSGGILSDDMLSDIMTGTLNIYSGPRPESANTPLSDGMLSRKVIDMLAAKEVTVPSDDKFLGAFTTGTHVNVLSYATTILDPQQHVMDVSFKDMILNHGKALRMSFCGHEAVDLDITVRLKIRAPRNMYDHWTAIARLKG